MSLWEKIKLGRELLSAWNTVEDKRMDQKALIKLAVAAVGAAVSAATAQYLASDTVNFSAVISAVLTTVFAFAKQSPVSK
jgi:uncharacterized membrane protein YfcA